jgi:hypothetical protein
MAKAVEMRAEHDQSGEQRLHAPIVEAQGGSALTVTLNWAHDLLVGSLANEAVVSDGLDVEETSIGLKADLPKRGARSTLRPCSTAPRSPYLQAKVIDLIWIFRGV